jgi:hypothetical protein
MRDDFRSCWHRGASRSVDLSPDHPGLLVLGSLEILLDAEEAS